MNKLEKRYSDNLELKRMAGEIEAWAFEPIRLRLTPIPLVGEKNPFYKPDFLVVIPHNDPVFGSINTFEFHETKGFFRLASLNRIKQAASLYPWFRFVAVTWDKRKGWEFREFKT